MSTETDRYTSSINRRTILRGAALTSVVGFVGVPAFSTRALATDGILDTCGTLDVVCAIDTSGSLSGSEVANLEAGINAFIDELPTDGSVLVGTVEFGNNGVRNKNDLQNPNGLTVSVSSPRGNTPMAGVIDLADQAVYGDSAARSDAVKLVVLFTDGGPNYTNTTYSVGGYTAPRDASSDWSAASGNGTYDNADTASATVSEGEMAETALVAASVKSPSVGDGDTLIATVYVGDSDTEAMTSGAITQYTDLPTYMADRIASGPEFAIDVDVANVQRLVDDLVAILDDLCCAPCPAAFPLKYEWVETDDAEGDCAGEFVVYDADDRVVPEVDGLRLVSVTCDEDGEPQEACFETTLCELSYVVKAGRDTESDTVTPADTDGVVCVSGIELANPRGKVVSHAISNVVFTCPEA
ncbi:vWA domain-containing protein [Haloplanus rubicundus]|nr:VWA domain-containing protein [Haloplanus rubicundus]